MDTEVFGKVAPTSIHLFYEVKSRVKQFLDRGDIQLIFREDLP